MALQHYLNALADGDLETLAALLRLAERDPLFERMIVETHAAIDSGADIRVNGQPRIVPPVSRPRPLPNRQLGRARLPLIAALLAAIIGAIFLLTRLPQRTTVVLSLPTATPTQSAINAQTAKALRIVGYLGSGEFNGALAWSPDGTLALATGNTVTFALGTEGSVPPPDDPGSNFVTALAYNADGSLLAIGRRSGVVSLWDVKAQTFASTTDTGQPVIRQVAFSSDGKTLAVVGPYGFTFWSLADDQQRLVAPTDDAVGLILLTPPYMTVSRTSFNVLNRNTADQQLRFPVDLTDKPITSVATSAPALVALGYEDGSVKLWNATTASVTTVAQANPQPVEHLTFSQHGNLIAVTSGSGVKVLKADDGAVVFASDFADEAAIIGIAFDPSGDAISVVRRDGSARVYELPSGTEVTRLNSGSGWLENAIFSPDGASMLVREHEQLSIWNASSQRLTRTLDGTAFWSGIAYAPDGKSVASLSYDGVTLTDAHTGKLIRDLKFAGDYANPVPGDGGDARSAAVAFSPDGSLIAAGRVDGSVFLWNAATGALVRTIAVQRTLVYSLAFSPDGKTIAASSGYSVGTDPLIHLIDVQSGKRLQTFKGYGDNDEVLRLAYSPDGKYLASVGGVSYATTSLIVWDAATGTQLLKKQLTAPSTALAYSPDGELLAVGYGDQSLRLLDTSNGNEIVSLSAPSVVTGVSWSAQGNLLGVTSTNGPVQLWGLR